MCTQKSTIGLFLCLSRYGGMHCSQHLQGFITIQACPLPYGCVEVLSVCLRTYFTIAFHDIMILTPLANFLKGEEFNLQVSAPVVAVSFHNLTTFFNINQGWENNSTMGEVPQGGRPTPLVFVNNKLTSQRYVFFR